MLTQVLANQYCDWIGLAHQIVTLINKIFNKVNNYINIYILYMSVFSQNVLCRNWIKEWTLLPEVFLNKIALRLIQNAFTTRSIHWCLLLFIVLVVKVPLSLILLLSTTNALKCEIKLIYCMPVINDFVY